MALKNLGFMDAVITRSKTTKTETLSVHNYLEAKSMTVFDAVALLFLMAFVFVVAYFFLFNQSLRLDEAQTLWQTSRDPGKLVQIVAQDVHVPLYHFILHYWQLYLGNSISSGRALSLIFFMLSIPLTYFLGKEAYSRRVGLFASVLMAASPFLNWYGSEIRMYSMLVFVALINQYYFVRTFKRRDAASFVGFGITALLGIFTHYYFLFLLISELIFFVVKKDLFPAEAKKWFKIISAVLMMFFIPWLAFVAKNGFAATTQPFLERPTTYNLFATVTEFIFGFQNQDLNRVLISLWPILILLAFFMLRPDRRKGSRRGVSAQTGFFMLAGALPMILVFIISLVKPGYLSRYLIFSIPSIYIIVSWLIYAHGDKSKRLLQSGLIALMILMMGTQTVSATSPVKEDYSDAVAYINQKATEKDVFLVAAPFTIYPVEYYYRGPAKLETIPQWDRFAGGLPTFDPSKMPEYVDSFKNDYQTAWLLLSYDQGFNDTVRLYMDTHFQRVDAKSFSPGMTLYAYKLRY